MPDTFPEMPAPQEDPEKSPSAKKQFQELLKGRMNIAPIINKLKDGTYESPVSEEDMAISFDWTFKDRQAQKENSQKALKTWNELKPERNALIAIFIEEVFHDMGTKFFDRRMNMSINEHRMLFFLQNETRNAFRASFTDWKRRRDEAIRQPKDTWSQIDRLYERYTKIIAFRNRARVDLGTFDEESFITRGVTTSLDVVCGVIDMVCKKAKDMKWNDEKTFSREEVIGIIKRSIGPTLMPFAMMHLQAATKLLAEIQTESFRFKEKYFFLEQNNKGEWMLNFDHSVIRRIRMEDGTPFLEFSPDSAATWCPATYAQGEERDVIRELSDGVLHLADINGYFNPFKKEGER